MQWRGVLCIEDEHVSELLVHEVGSGAVPLALEILEEAHSAHDEHLLDRVPELVVALDVVEVLVHAVQLLHEEHGVEAPPAVILEHVEHDVLSEGRGEVLPVEMSLRVPLILQLLAVLGPEVKVLQQFVEAPRESMAVDELHGLCGDDGGDGLELDEPVELADGLLGDVSVLDNFDDHVWHRDEQVHVLLTAVEVLDAVHVVHASLEILAEELVDLPLETVHLLIQDLLVLLVELYCIHFQSLPVDLVWGFLFFSKLALHVSLILLLDLWDAVPLEHFLLAVWEADLREVHVEAGRVLYLDERKLVVFAHPDHLNVPKVVLVLHAVLLLLALPLDFDWSLLPELLQHGVEATKALSVLELPLLQGHALDEGELQDALCSNVLEEPLASTSPVVFLPLVEHSGLFFVEKAVLYEFSILEELLLDFVVEDEVHVDVMDLDEPLFELFLRPDEGKAVQILGIAAQVPQSLAMSCVEVATYLAVDFAQALEVHLIVEAKSGGLEVLGAQQLGVLALQILQVLKIEQGLHSRLACFALGNQLVLRQRGQVILHGGYLELVPLRVDCTIVVELILDVAAVHLSTDGLKSAGFSLLRLQFFIEAPLPKLEALEVLEELLELRLPDRQGFVALHGASGPFYCQCFVLLHGKKSSDFGAQLREDRPFQSNLVLSSHSSLHKLQELSGSLDLARRLLLLSFLLISGARGAAHPLAPDIFVNLGLIALGTVRYVILRFGVLSLSFWALLLAFLSLFDDLSPWLFCSCVCSRIYRWQGCCLGDWVSAGTRFDLISDLKLYNLSSLIRR